MQLLAPAPYASFSTRSGNFTADANGLIYGVSASTAGGTAVQDLIDEGCIPLAVNPSANFRNLLDGGDFTVNPWQRGTAFSGITSTPTYTADRFFAVGGASSSISVSQQAATIVPGFSQALQFGRAAANTNTAVISLGQILETADSIRCQSQYLTVSFWALAGATFSGAGLSVGLQSGTGSNQSSTNLMSGSWTTQSQIGLTPAQANGVAGLSGVYGVGTAAQQPINQGWTRYSFTTTAPVPAGATQLALTVGYTPVGTAGSTDYVQFMGFQLEIESQATPFEHRDVQVELEIAQRYAWVISEPAANVVVSAGYNTSSAAQLFYIATPVQLRANPTITFGGTASWKVHTAGAPASATLASGGGTPNAISLTANAAGTLGQGCVLVGGGGTGTVIISADF